MKEKQNTMPKFKAQSKRALISLRWADFLTSFPPWPSSTPSSARLAPHLKTGVEHVTPNEPPHFSFFFFFVGSKTQKTLRLKTGEFAPSSTLRLLLPQPQPTLCFLIFSILHNRYGPLRLLRPFSCPEARESRFFFLSIEEMHELLCFRG